ncbi:MAG: TIGR00269 family protein [Caldiserica bacterium]|nr:TIGR00269 family protein [Caldisericota bacterium]
MKCRKCGERAAIKLYQHNLSLCREHFCEFVEERVKKAIHDFCMFEKEEKILVVISGGKDSLALSYILNKLGYSVSLLYIDLGIDEYSDNSRKFCEEFARKFALSLKIISLREEWGKGIRAFCCQTYKSICSLCGLVKRYYFNKVAYEEGFDVVATGHNLDDMVSALLSNLLGWRTSYLVKQLPLLPEEGRLKKKAKPLIYLTERETAAYAFLSGISFLREECPYSRDASFLRMKHLLNEVERSSPGTKFSFYRGFLEKRHLFQEQEEKVDLKDCLLCGFPSLLEICSFCKTFRKEEVKNAGKI